MILIFIISKLLNKIIRAFRNVLLNSCIVSKESLVKDQVCQVREFPDFARCEISAAMMVVGLHYIYVYIFYSISIFHIDFLSSRTTIFTVFTLDIFQYLQLFVADFRHFFFSLLSPNISWQSTTDWATSFSWELWTVEQMFLVLLCLMTGSATDNHFSRI